MMTLSSTSQTPDWPRAADPVPIRARCAGEPRGLCPVEPTEKESGMAEIKDPENTIIIELKDGPVVIELLSDDRYRGPHV